MEVLLKRRKKDKKLIQGLEDPYQKEIIYLTEEEAEFRASRVKDVEYFLTICLV
jgi:hypothetical protein